MMKELTGTGSLVRLILRRDRIALLIWVLVISFIPMGNVIGFSELYPTEDALQAFVAETESNATLMMIFGNFPSVSLGGIAAWRSLPQLALFMAIPSLLLVLRHTRTEEAKGRRELLAATVLGRHAPLTAALIVVFGMNLLIAIVMAIGLIAVGLAMSDSIILALSFISAGAMFTAIAAVIAQLRERPASAIGHAFTVLGVVLGLRFVVNTTGWTWLRWLSPFNWINMTGAFGEQQIWIFAIIIGFVILLTVLAYRLSTQRDLGTGILAERTGGASSSSSLDSPLALAWRLQRESLQTWLVIVIIAGVLIGSQAQYINSSLSTEGITNWMSQFGVQNQGDALLRVLIYVIGMILLLYSLTAAMKLSKEEKQQRAEMLLALPISRLRWAMSHLLFAYGGTTLIFVVFGLAVSISYGIGTNALATEFPRLFGRTLSILPALWVLISIAVVFYGFVSRFSEQLTWAVFAGIILVEMAWELQFVSQSIFNISPFAHVHWTTSEITIAPILMLVLVAAILGGAGIAGLQRRDIN